MTEWKKEIQELINSEQLETAFRKINLFDFNTETNQAFTALSDRFIVLKSEKKHLSKHDFREQFSNIEAEFLKLLTNLPRFLTPNKQEYYNETSRPIIADKPLSVFISYSSKDKKYLDDIKIHLSRLKRLGKAETWTDAELKVGEWDEQIIIKLKQSDIILLLVSPDFIDSDYIWEKELKIAIKRQKSGEACVIPIALRALKWDGFPFAELTGTPKEEGKLKPVSEWENEDKAWQEVVKLIESTIDSFKEKAISLPRNENFCIEIESNTFMKGEEELFLKIIDEFIEDKSAIMSNPILNNLPPTYSKALREDSQAFFSQVKDCLFKSLENHKESLIFDINLAIKHIDNTKHSEQALGSLLITWGCLHYIEKVIGNTSDLFKNFKQGFVRVLSKIIDKPLTFMKLKSIFKKEKTASALTDLEHIEKTLSEKLGNAYHTEYSEDF